jgi:hypothetical protein
MGLRSAEKTCTYTTEYGDIFEEAYNALSGCGFIVSRTDNPSGIIKAYAGASFRSYGEDITVSITKNANGITVTARSKSRAALFDWGKNKENVSNFFAALQDRLHSRKRVKSPLGHFE